MQTQMSWSYLSMHDLVQLPDELSFLREMYGNRKIQFRRPSWLKEGFAKPRWRCDFGDNRRLDIDFRIRLDDGGLLTSSKYSSLLNTIKCWLCIQTHSDVTGGISYSAHTAYSRVLSTLHLADYFFLNSRRFQLSKHGLLQITENDLRGLIVELARSSDVVDSIYQWKEKLTIFLKNQSRYLGKDQLKAVLKECPPLFFIDIDQDDRTLELSDAELIRARAFLWANGYYSYESGNASEYRYAPETVRLATQIYPNTLAGISPKPHPTELRLIPREVIRREHLAVPVRTAVGDEISAPRLVRFKNILRSMGLLAEIKLPVPLSALKAADNRAVNDAIRLKKPGRYRTLPQHVVFPSLRNAIEFSLKYGDAIVDSFLALVKASAKAGMNYHAYCKRYGIHSLLTPKLRKLGVQTWSVCLDFSVVDYNPRARSSSPLKCAEYFERFRANEGLYELICVLYGSVAICVGTLMARRQRELRDLVAGKCLDKSRTRLIFLLGKSGIEDKRQHEVRPIPPVAVKLISQLERLQRGLIDAGLLTHPTNLFRRPLRLGCGLALEGSQEFYRALDYFCDYFETALDKNGRRYYIRQHQLRRFFAILFFWGSSFGRMDALRWFLGHIDIEHLYHYLTESTPGAVLRSIKAGFATDRLRIGAKETTALADLLEKHFHTRNFSVLDDEELEEYIEDLLDEGAVTIEPKFFKARNGKSYRILIKVSKGISQ